MEPWDYEQLKEIATLVQQGKNKEAVAAANKLRQDRYRHYARLLRLVGYATNECQPEVDKVNELITFEINRR